MARAVAQRSATGLALDALEAVGGSVPEALEAAALAQDLSMRPGWALMHYPHNLAALEAFQGLEELTGRPTRVVVIDFPAAVTMNPPSPHGGAPSTVLALSENGNHRARRHRARWFTTPCPPPLLYARDPEFRPDRGLIGGLLSRFRFSACLLTDSW
jgi:hypothetical protein